jgi:hypothetical protein
MIHHLNKLAFAAVLSFGVTGMLAATPAEAGILRNVAKKVVVKVVTKVGQATIGKGLAGTIAAANAAREQGLGK